MKRYDFDIHADYSESTDGGWIRYTDHVEAMKRIAGASAQHAEPAVVRKTFVFDGVRNPDFVPLRIEFEPGYPEDVAFGTQRQMDRLKKWLDKFFAMRTAQSASPAALTVICEKLARFNECAEDDEGVDIGRAWLDALTTIGLLERAQRSPARWEMTDAGNALLSDSASVLADADLDRMWHEVASASGTTVGMHRRFARALLAVSPADQVEDARDAARYRWLRDESPWCLSDGCRDDPEFIPWGDETVDAAMRCTPPAA